MTVIGTVDSLWRYPVKSMRGQELDEAYITFSGMYGDRLYAFKSSAAHKGFPYLTAREQRKMLQFRPHFRYSEKSALPVNLAEAASLSPNINPAPADAKDLVVDVETPNGPTLPIDGPALLTLLRDGVSGDPDLTLIRSDRGMTDCRPISLFSVQSARQLSDELGGAVDERRFRANIYLNFHAELGAAENSLVGRSVRVGPKLVISILERDPRCVMITLDPETGESNPKVLRQVAQAHDGFAGVYAAVLVEGILRRGDNVELLD